MWVPYTDEATLQLYKELDLIHPLEYIAKVLGRYAELNANSGYFTAEQVRENLSEQRRHGKTTNRCLYAATLALQGKKIGIKVSSEHWEKIERENLEKILLRTDALSAVAYKQIMNNIIFYANEKTLHGHLIDLKINDCWDT